MTLQTDDTGNDKGTNNKWKITVDAFGRGVVMLNGVDISNQVQGIAIRFEVTELTRVTVDYIPNELDLETEESRPVLLRDADFLGLTKALKRLDFGDDR